MSYTTTFTKEDPRSGAYSFQTILHTDTNKDSFTDLKKIVTKVNNNGHLQIQSEKEIKAPSGEVKRKSRTGCLTCKSRKVKCDEGKPVCKECFRINMKCIYKQIPNVLSTDNISSNDYKSNEKRSLPPDKPKVFTFDAVQTANGSRSLKESEVVVPGYGVVKVIRGKIAYKIENGVCIYRA